MQHKTIAPTMGPMMGADRPPSSSLHALEHERPPQSPTHRKVLLAKVAANDATAEEDFEAVMAEEDNLNASYGELNKKIRELIAGPGAPMRDEFLLVNYTFLPDDWEPPDPAEWPGDWLSNDRRLGLGRGGEYPRTTGPTAEELG